MIRLTSPGMGYHRIYPESNVRDSPERAAMRDLAQHVISQAFVDALEGARVQGWNSHEAREREVKRVRERAATWLASGRYYPWDEAAGWDRDAIMRAYKEKANG